MKIQDGSFTEQLEHTAGEDIIVIKEPTESEAGISLYTCTVCKTMGVKVTSALGAYVLETVAESDSQDRRPGETEEKPSTDDKSSDLSDPEYENNQEIRSDDACEAKKGVQIKNPVPGKNTVFQFGSCLYKITKSAAKGGTAELKAPTKKTLKSVSIPQTANIDGYTFQVTGIGKNAFRGCSKLKQIIVKSERIDHMGKNAWKGIHAKASIRAPKAVKKEYTKLIRR